MRDDLQDLDASTRDSIYEGSQLLRNISVLQDKVQGKRAHPGHAFFIWDRLSEPCGAPVLQTEAGLLNETAEEELPPANQTRLQQEVELMLDGMRALNLAAAGGLANQQLL